MSEPLVIDFLRTHTLTELLEQHGVNARVSTRDPCVATLNYDQIRVRDDDPLASQCRGMVIRADSPIISEVVTVGNARAIARPFERFFNLGQAACAPVDFSDAVFYEKLDGTFCIVYYDAGAWHVATRGTPDADVPINETQLTFRQLFELALEETALRKWSAWTKLLLTGYTYMFELTAPENQVVVAYQKRGVSLLAVRSQDGVDLPHYDVSAEAFALFVPMCPSHTVGSADASAWVAQRDPAQFEGLVVRDSAGRRCKVKHPGYVALNAIAFARSPRAMMRSILAGTDDDAERVLPASVRPTLVSLRDGLGRWCRARDEFYDSAPKGDRKELAMATNAAGEWMPYVMARFTGKTHDAAAFARSLRREGDWTDATVDFLIEGAGRA